jgi:zinc/manganese transport system substrate-binding protein
MLTSRNLFCRALLGLLLYGSATFAGAAGKLNVVGSTQDMAALAREVGGDKINVDAIAQGYQDPHFVDPKPSFLLRLQKADLLVVVGRQLELGWLPPLLTQSRNPKIQVGQAGYLDASLTCEILEIPTGEVTRAMGDVHPVGNPHYWLDPDNGRRIAKAIQQKLAALDAADAAYFAQRFEDFDKRVVEAKVRWTAKMAPYKGREVVTYHNSWPSFTKQFGLKVVGYIEPKPGIPPTPSHTLELIGFMKSHNVKIILVEPYFDMRTPQSIARQAGGEVATLMPSVGGVKEIKDYFDLFDYDINLLVGLFAKVH